MYGMQVEAFLDLCERRDPYVHATDREQQKVPDHVHFGSMSDGPVFRTDAPCGGRGFRLERVCVASKKQATLRAPNEPAPNEVGALVASQIHYTDFTTTLESNIGGATPYGETHPSNLQWALASQGEPGQRLPVTPGRALQRPWPSFCAQQVFVGKARSCCRRNRLGCVHVVQRGPTQDKVGGEDSFNVGKAARGQHEATAVSDHDSGRVQARLPGKSGYITVLPRCFGYHLRGSCASTVRRTRLVESRTPLRLVGGMESEEWRGPTPIIAKSSTI